MKIVKLATISLFSTVLLFGSSAVFNSAQTSASSESTSSLSIEAKAVSKQVSVELFYNAGSYYTYSDAQGYYGRIPFLRQVNQSYIYQGTVYLQ